MGLFTDIFGRKRRIDKPDEPLLGVFIGSQVRTAEDQVSRFADWSNAQKLSKYVRNLALDAGMFNATNLASVPLRLYRVSDEKSTQAVDARTYKRLTNSRCVGVKVATMAGGAASVVEVPDAEPVQLLRNPDPTTTGTAWDIARWLDKQMYGECLLLVSDQGLVRLMPQFAKVQPDKNELVAGWYYGRDSNDQARFEAGDVLQLKWAEHPDNPYRGLGWLDTAIREIEIDSYAIASELIRWRNGGYPEGLLSFDNANMSQKQIDEAVRKFRAQIRSRDKLIVTSKSHYTPLAVAKDMAFVQGLELVERRLLNRAGIPESLYKLNDANLASSTTGHRDYALYTLRPALTVDAEQWTVLLLPLYGLDPQRYFFAYDEVVPEDRAEKISTATSLTGAGIITINEAREMMDLPPVDGGDDLRVNGQSLDALDTPFGGAYQTPQASMPLLTSNGQPVDAITLSWGDSDPYEPWMCNHSYKADDRLPDDQVRAIERIFRAYFEQLTGGITGETLISGINFADYDSSLMSELQPVLVAIVRDSARRAYQQIGESRDLFESAPEQALELIDRRASLIIEQVRGTTEAALRDAIRQAVEQNLTVNAAAELVAQAIGDSAASRAETIARTEVANAIGEGEHAAWQDSGIKQTQWLLAPDACSICVAMVNALGDRDGRLSRPVDMGSPYVTAGTILIGSDGRKMAVKRDVYHSPLHPNDRCTTVPVVE